MNLSLDIKDNLDVSLFLSHDFKRLIELYLNKPKNKTIVLANIIRLCSGG